jgi:hypothetical protein
MKRMLRNLAVTAVAVAVTMGCDGTASASAVPAEASERRPVDLAICLDTSGSMQGLIESVKRKLWDITNELAKAKPTPRMRVALLTYGNDGHNAAEGWVRMDSGLTEDLDTICQQLFALSTNGGTEYVGRVIQASLDRLDWTPSNEALKLIFVAGNESADQDRQVSFRDACRRAIAKGIMVNAIYCGPASHGDAPVWREVAALADGQFASIDQNNGTVEVATPFDAELQRLSASLNTTYLPFGREGAEGAARQVAQDSSVASLSAPAAASRAGAKASAVYRNGSWDLVDAVSDRGVDLETAKPEELPEPMRAMNGAERKAHVEAMAAKRAEIQKAIGSLNASRQAHIAAEQAKAGKAGDAAFDAAVRSAMRGQAEKRGFSFE